MLHYACLNRNLTIIEKILELKEDINILNLNGKSPFYYAELNKIPLND
jgi:ankyrin repeat protein